MTGDTSASQPPSQQDYVDAVTRLFNAGETDINGGVHTTTVHEELDAAPSTIREHLNALADDGRLDRVNGWSPETGRPRMSFRPPEDR
ncbi:hypothetical protein [Halostella pelagica]|uniref:hypothetical protein n=1 Tax=Halostella pelagica TaxID=2583824 RepID=UPI0010807C6A|nr:hypothetical protein [Halostella pelagica]